MNPRSHRYLSTYSVLRENIKIEKHLSIPGPSHFSPGRANEHPRVPCASVVPLPSCYSPFPLHFPTSSSSFSSSFLLSLRLHLLLDPSFFPPHPFDRFPRPSTIRSFPLWDIYFLFGLLIFFPVSPSSFLLLPPLFSLPLTFHLHFSFAFASSQPGAVVSAPLPARGSTVQPRSKRTLLPPVPVSE